MKFNFTYNVYQDIHKNHAYWQAYFSSHQQGVAYKSSSCYQSAQFNPLTFIYLEIYYN